MFNHRGEPLSLKEFDRFHTCDLLMRPFTMEPQFEPGNAAFQPPERPFRIALPMTVPGFGEVFVYADNRGRGYTAQSFSDKPLLLNYEFAADRLATVRTLLEECQRSGITISAAARERAEKAKALLEQAEGLAQDRPAYVASADVVVVRIAVGRRDDGDRARGSDDRPERPAPRLSLRLQCRGSPSAQPAIRQSGLQRCSTSPRWLVLPGTGGARARSAGLLGRRRVARMARPHEDRHQGPPA